MFGKRHDPPPPLPPGRRVKGGTMFSGIGAPECSAPWVDWRWCAEIEAFPAAVHATRFPHIPNLGDVLADDFLDRANALGPLDVLVGGPPCQAFSIAGLRRSLDDARGNLTLRWVQVIHAVDPRWAVTENVPGWLSTKDNAFGCFLAALVGADAPLVPPRECGGRWTDAGVVVGPERDAAWRIIDAQFFGLAQRRRRVFVVSRRAGDGISADALLPLAQSLSGNPPPRRETREGIAAPLTRGADSGGRGGYAGRRREDDENLVAAPLAASPKGGSGYRNDADTAENLVSHSLRADGFDASEDGTGRGTPLVAHRLNAHPSRRIDGESETFVAFQCNGTNIGAGDISGTLRQGNQHVTGGAPMVATTSVRRLTPLECERLQGFPGGWTAITYRGKPAADGPRYRCLGNSMAVPVLAWILGRLRDVDALTSEDRRAA